MTNKLTEALALKIKQEFVEGVHTDSGELMWPTIDFLVKKHEVARATLFRRSRSEDWQAAKNQFQTALEQKRESERVLEMAEESKRLDVNSLQIAQAMLSRVGRKLQRSFQTEQNTDTEILSTAELRELSQVATNAQKIGKLALGEASEIAKVSADVSAPETFRDLMEQMDELAKARSSRHGHTIQ